MFTIILIIASFRAGCPLLGIFVAILFWTIIISGCKKSNVTTHTKQNPIDKHGDEIYGDINWFYDGKL